MSCCSGGTKWALSWVTRLSFGLSLLFVGIVHLMGVSQYATNVADGLGVLSPLGTIWGYILPILMIVGGALFVIGMFNEIAVWAAGLALGSLPMGVMLKSLMGGPGLDVTMPMAMNAWVWFIVFLLSVKYLSCGCGCGPMKCNCGSKDCPACNGKRM